MRQTIAVLGGSGFLGGEIVAALNQQGYRTRIVARHPERGAYKADQTVSADIRDGEALREALRGCDAAVNAVSLYVEQGGLTFQAIHVDGAANLGRVAREEGLQRLVHISGIGVDAVSPSPYIRARTRGEQATLTAFPRATVLRPSVLFGPGDDFLRTLNLLTLLPLIPLFGRGQTLLQPVLARDVARAVVASLDHPETAAQTFELPGAETLTYRQAVEQVLRARKRRRLLLPLSFGLWHALARITSLLPGAPLTRDQVWLMQTDNCADPQYPGFQSLGLTPASFSGALRESLPD
jgi:uncharacterized protein YbjT (DUF2867 family)